MTLDYTNIIYGFIFLIDNKRKSIDTISQMSGSPSGYGPLVCSRGNEYHVMSVIFRSLVTRVVMTFKELKLLENSVSILLTCNVCLILNINAYIF